MVEVEVEVEAMVEETVKVEVEEKVMEEKALGEGQWLRGFWGTRDAGAIRDLPWDPAVLAGPQPLPLPQKPLSHCPSPNAFREDPDLDADLVSAHGDGGGSTRRRPTGGRMPDRCTASPPGRSPSPSPLQPPQPGAPRSRTPPTPGMPSPRPWGPSPPPWTGKARYVDCVLALI